MEDTLSNYDMDEIDRLNEKEKSQKQKEQWRNYVDNNLEHTMDLKPDADVVKEHVETENEEMTKDPVGYERRHTPKSTLPLGNKDELDDQGNIREIISQDWKRNPSKNVHHA